MSRLTRIVCSALCAFVARQAAAAPAPPVPQVSGSAIRGAGAAFHSPRPIDIWGGASEFIVLGADGAVWTWGWNDYGVLGNGSAVTMSDVGPPVRQLFPQRVLGPGGASHLASIAAIAGGERHNVALDTDGFVWVWGWNFLGQLGTGAACPDRNASDCRSPTPVKVPGLTAVAAVSSRGYHTLALKIDGTVWAWGFNDAGQLGDGTNIDRRTPVQVHGLDGHGGVRTIVGGGKVNLALMADSTLLAWGQNSEGAVGNGVFDTSGLGVTIPTAVSTTTGIADITQIAVGWNHVVALDSNGTVWTWGENTHGQIGDGTTTHRNAPYHLPGLSDVVAVSAGDGHTEVVRSDGTVWTWGDNRYAQLGDGTTSPNRRTPQQVPGLDHVVTVRARNWNSAAITADGTVWVWGDNGQGQCGNGRFGDNQPVPVEAIFPWRSPRMVSVSGGARHAVALRSDGTAWTWGINMSGLIGDNTVSTFQPSDPFGNGTNDRHTPVQVHGPANVGVLTSIVAVMGGEPYNFALKSDGTVWAWGNNMFGQLGDGSTVDRPVPVQVSGLTDVNALGGRGYHSLALKGDGTVWTWGFNSAGQLGDGTLANRSTPVQALGLTGALAVTGGYVHSVALMADHTLKSWGGNSNGQLGDGSFASRSTAVPVGTLSNVVQVSAGWKHTLAVDGNGLVWAWGANTSGQLGDGSTASSATPTVVAGIDHAIAVSGGDCHSAALKSDGTVWTWGCNDRGELGDGTSTERHSPTLVAGLDHVAQIAARDYHNYALRRDGSIVAWGWNVNGQLGDGTTTDRPTPTLVSGIRGASEPPTFTDDPLQRGVTRVKATHVLELRQQIDLLRTRNGLAAFAWTDPTLVPGHTVPRALHISDMRTALGGVYDALGLIAPTYSHPVISPGTATMTAAEFSELRAAVVAIW